MIQLTSTHPYEACTAFAIQWLRCVARYDLAAAEAMIDANDSDMALSECLPPPEGFTYADPDGAFDWTVHFMGGGPRGLSCHFEVPFVERGFRPVTARFHMRRTGDVLEVRFEGIVP